ncbi:MAG: hypothetical protein LBB21_05580 [Holosporaceae bacterium]|jgi:hypothetical protein|nr:hypothetical protein [Holosporaceae bacterium]
MNFNKVKAKFLANVQVEHTTVTVPLWSILPCSGRKKKVVVLSPWME